MAAFRMLTQCVSIRLKTTIAPSLLNDSNPIVQKWLPTSQFVRETSFLTRLTADQLWKGVTSVSNAGKKRGRGKGTSKRVPKDLNRGQILGVGKINMIWPGLNAPVLKGREVVKQQELPPDPDREEKIIKLRGTGRGFQTLKLNPLERGYSGIRMPGRKIGPPDPVGEEMFENFDTTVLEMRMVCHMEANTGRKRQMRVLAITGNRNGLAGIGIGRGPDGRSALRRAKNQAAKNLFYIKRFEEHTICHDFFSAYRHSKLYVKKQPKGYGLVCHRVIKSICEQIGITDLHAKVENSTNPLFVTKAFLQGLQEQKTQQELADEIGLNVIETRPERDNFPRVIAKPKKSRTRKEIPTNEITDYEEIITEGRVQIPHKEKIPFFVRFPSWQIHLKKVALYRNAVNTRAELAARYGEGRSFLTIKEEQRKADKIKMAANSEN